MQRVDNVPDGARIDDDPDRFPATYDEDLAAQQRASDDKWERFEAMVAKARARAYPKGRKL